MLIPFTPEWRRERDRSRRAGAFVTAVRREPGDADVEWLADAAARGDRERKHGDQRRDQREATGAAHGGVTPGRSEVSMSGLDGVFFAGGGVVAVPVPAG